MTRPPVARSSPARGLLIVAGAAIVALGLAHAWLLRFVFDDAYISFRFAEHLAQGHGLVFNAGERVEGYSNFLWTVLMSVVALARGDLAAWSVGLGLACAAGTLIVLLGAGIRRGRGVLPALLTASSTAWAVWATGGLETSLYTLLVTAGALATLLAIEPDPHAGAGEGVDSRAFLLGGLALGLGCLTRPDGVLVAGCVGLWVLWRAVRGGVAWSRAAAWAGLVAVCVLPHMAWRLSYYGHVFPNTVAVKSPGAHRATMGLGYLADASIDLALVIPLVAIIVTLAFRQARRLVSRADWVVLGVVIVPYLAYVTTTGGDFMPAYRFVAPIVPLLAWVGGSCLNALRVAWPRRVRAAGAGVVLAVVTCAYVAINLAGSWRQLGVWSKGELVSVGWSREQTDEWLRVGELLGTIAAPGDTLATTAAGAIPWRSGLYTIDMLGLNAPDLSKFRRRATDRPGHTLLYDERWLDASPPQFLLAHPLVRPTPRGTGLSLDFLPEWRDRVLAHYEVLVLRLPGEPERYVACGVRKDVLARAPAARP